MLSRTFAPPVWVILWLSVAGGQIRPPVIPGDLIIETSPYATVTLDGAEAGKVPGNGRLVISGLTPGVHLLQVQHPDKWPFSRKVTVQSGKRNLIRATLADYTGVLEILTTPEAEVLVDGKPAGVVDAVGRLVVKDLRAGTHSIRAGRVGYNSQERSVRISADVTTTLTMELAPIHAIAEHDAAPPPNFALARKLPAHSANSVRVVFRSDSLQLLSWALPGERERLLKLWDPGTGRELSSVKVESPYLFEGAISPDFRLLLAFTPWNVADPVIMDLRTSKQIVRLPRPVPEPHRDRRVDDAAFSADGERLAMQIRSGELMVWNVRKGEKLQSWYGGAPAWSPDGRWLATTAQEWEATATRESIVIRDGATLAEVRRIPSKAGRLLFSPNSLWLAVVNERVDLWDPATGKQGRTIMGPRDRVCFTGDSRFLASVSDSTIRLWDIATGAEARNWPYGDARNIAFSPDGKWMAIGEDGGGLSIWRREN